MGIQIGVCHLAEMSARSIPDQHQWPGHVPLHMLKRFNQLRAFDGAFEMAFVNLA